MYYFDRADGLKSIAAKTELAEERELLAELCNTYWDTSDLRPADAQQLAVFRNAAHYPGKIIWDWAMIGIALKCRFENEFRELFAELLSDADTDVRRRMASKVSRLEGAALEAIVPVMLMNSDPDIRRIAYTFYTPASDQASDMQERVTIIDEFVAAETDDRNRDELLAARKALEGLISGAIRSRELFDWARYEDTLVQASEAVFREIGHKHADMCLRGCLVFCDPGNTSIVLQFERCRTCEGVSDRALWDYDEQPSTLDVNGPIEKLWDPVEQEIAERRHRDSVVWAVGEDPDQDFIVMARRAAERLQTSNALTALKRSKEFQVIAMTADECDAAVVGDLS